MKLVIETLQTAGELSLQSDRIVKSQMRIQTNDLFDPRSSSCSRTEVSVEKPTPTRPLTFSRG